MAATFTVIGVYEERFESVACVVAAESQAEAREKARPIFATETGDDIVILAIIDGAHGVYDAYSGESMAVGPLPRAARGRRRRSV